MSIIPGKIFAFTNKRDFTGFVLGWVDFSFVRFDKSCLATRGLLSPFGSVLPQFVGITSNDSVWIELSTPSRVKCRVEYFRYRVIPEVNSKSRWSISGCYRDKTSCNSGKTTLGDNSWVIEDKRRSTLADCARKISINVYIMCIYLYIHTQC